MRLFKSSRAFWKFTDGGRIKRAACLCPRFISPTLLWKSRSCQTWFRSARDSAGSDPEQRLPVRFPPTASLFPLLLPSLSISFTFLHRKTRLGLFTPNDKREEEMKFGKGKKMVCVWGGRGGGYVTSRFNREEKQIKPKNEKEIKHPIFTVKN